MKLEMKMEIQMKVRPMAIPVAGHGPEARNSIEVETSTKSPHGDGARGEALGLCGVDFGVFWGFFGEFY